MKMLFLNQNDVRTAAALHWDKQQQQHSWVNETVIFATKQKEEFMNNFIGKPAFYVARQSINE